MSFTALISARQLAESSAALTLLFVTQKHLTDLQQPVFLPATRALLLQQLCDVASPLSNSVPAASQFSRVMTELGITLTDSVVLYDDGNMIDAARAWWLFTLFGHRQVRVLDGGSPALSGVLQTNAALARPQPASRTWRCAFHAQRIRGLGDMLDNLHSHEAQVIDARRAARFAGQEEESTPHLRRGHIPGSVNLPYGELLTPDHRFLPLAALRRRFQQLSLIPAQPIITTCGSGMSAAVLALALSVAGYSRWSLYDGAWQEWGSDVRTVDLVATTPSP